MPATLILVSGTWHASWCWELIVPIIEQAGHKVIAPDLIGMGEDPTPTAGVRLGDWVDQIVALVQAETQPVVLTGYSRGGAIVGHVAERMPERVARIVYIAGLMLQAGDTLRNASARMATSKEPLLTLNEDFTSQVRPEIVQSQFYGTTPAPLVERAIAKMGMEPMGVFLAPIAVSAERFGRVPRAYIECLRDVAVPIAFQQEMQAAWPCDPVFTLDCDHSPHYSQPEALAAHLITLCDMAG